MQGNAVICHTCGKELRRSMERMPCEELVGWITVARWKGREAVDHNSFCSVDCMREWVDDLLPRVPKVFLESFDQRGLKNEGD
ncbi:MAG: hypothetical protein SVM79_09440, partial [Chloroflexota bacterium]|nr:hypothetical protein [Chloroflexota bacterium]